MRGLRGFELPLPAQRRKGAKNCNGKSNLTPALRAPPLQGERGKTATANAYGRGHTRMILASFRNSSELHLFHAEIAGLADRTPALRAPPLQGERGKTATANADGRGHTRMEIGFLP